MGPFDFVLSFLLFFIFKGVSGATFTFINKCPHTVWPGILGQPFLDTTGFELATGNSRSLRAPPGWSGRFWGRTGCTFDSSGHGSCQTADCGTRAIECNGAGASPPATLAEFTLGSAPSAQDFYDVSLVDGYNIQMMVEVSGGSGGCETTGCVDDVNRRCPVELRVAGGGDGGGGCRSACEAFGSPEYCCKGEYGSPETCRPTVYSQVFKIACPRSYSYAYDDATSTFTCTGADYVITFCPSSLSGKSGKDLRNPTNTSRSNPLKGFLSNSSLYADLATSGSSLIHRPSLTLLFIIFINILIPYHLLFSVF